MASHVFLWGQSLETVVSLRDDADARFYFITAPWEASPHLPQHTALCVQVRTLHFLLVRLPSDWISPFRKRENGSHTLANTLAGRSPVWERPSQPPSRWLWISWVWKPVQPQTWKAGQNLLEWHHLAAEDLLLSPGWHPATTGQFLRSYAFFLSTDRNTFILRAFFSFYQENSVL